MFNFWKKQVPKVEPKVNADGSLFKVPLTTILKVGNHPNADRLDVCTVYGFEVVTQKGKYQVGDLAIYVPIDSILDSRLEAQLFPHVKNETTGEMEPPKVKLNKSRVRQIRLRKHVSQGMLIHPSELNGLEGVYNPEDDLAEVLNITKYEPPVGNSSGNAPGTKKGRNKPNDNQHFRKYNGVNNIKWSPHRFADEEVVIQEKIHGSHARAMWAPYSANTVWKKIKRMFGYTPKWEFCIGSNNVEVSNKKQYSGFYADDIYTAAMKKYDAINKIKHGEAVHFEIYGPNIQANYTYGATEHKLVMYDVRVLNDDGTQRWLNPEECEAYAKERGFDFVPVLYTGPFNLEKLAELTSGPSVFAPSQKVREGVVVKSRFKYDIDQNKQCLKSINPSYLDDQTNTDNH